jgi:hypothetical protein
MQFDVGLISRVSNEIKESANRLQQHVNSPNELNMEIQKIESSINSLKNLSESAAPAGANAKTTQLSPDQNQT